MKIFLLMSILLSMLIGDVNGQVDENSLEYPSYWSANKEYTYKVNYFDSTENIISTERLILRPTGEIWEADSRQTLVDFILDSLTADWEKIGAIPLNGRARSWMTQYQEGALQNSHKIWIHPLRQNQYLLTELAPFPEVYFPIKKEATWNDTLEIYPAFGTFEGTVESKYTITEMETRSYDFGNISCWKIMAIGKHSKLGENAVIYYFNKDFGFIEMNYVFYNKQKIEIKLIQFSDHK